MKRHVCHVVLAAGAWLTVVNGGRPCRAARTQNAVSSYNCCPQEGEKHDFFPRCLPKAREALSRAALGKKNP